MTETIKILNFFKPLPGREEHSEEYYRNVHIPLIARTLRADPRWISYQQNRLVASYDPLGGFNRPPDRWRLVILRGRLEEAGPTGRSVRPNNPELQRVVELDHPNFLSAIARMEAVETTAHDTLRGQTSLRKYVVAIPEDEDRPGRRAADTTERLVAGLVSAPGCRLVLVNAVLGEVESTVKGSAVVPSGAYKDQATFARVVELYFDNPFDAATFFAEPARQELLLFDHPGTEVYAVEETCGFDRR